MKNILLFLMLVQVGSDTWVDPSRVIAVKGFWKCTEITLAAPRLREGVISDTKQDTTTITSDWSVEQVVQALKAPK